MTWAFPGGLSSSEMNARRMSGASTATVVNVYNRTTTFLSSSGVHVSEGSNDDEKHVQGRSSSMYMSADDGNNPASQRERTTYSCRATGTITAGSHPGTVHCANQTFYGKSKCKEKINVQNIEGVHGLVVDTTISFRSFHCKRTRGRGSIILHKLLSFHFRIS